MIKLTKAGIILPIDYNELIEKASAKNSFYFENHYTESQAAGLKTLLNRRKQIVNPEAQAVTETSEVPEAPEDPDDIDL